MQQINQIRLSGVRIPIPGMPFAVPDMTFARGERWIIEAESGTGKSSLCSFIYGARTDYEGTISFDNRDIRSLSVSDWCDVRCRHIVLLPQQMSMFPELSAIDNVLIKNRLTDCLQRPEIEALFAELGIADKIDTPARLLSVGQQQRVAIVRTIAQPADFILLDEPVSHLDSRNNSIAARIIERYAERWGAAIIATSVGNPLLLSGNVSTITLKHNS